MAPLILTLVRHGESTDNLTAIWAGHRDAPLSNHGFAQAKRLGQAFKDVPITAIYTSDLKRARTTAECVYEASTLDPKPPFTVSSLLREQYFGEAEGQPWNAGRFNSAHLPWEEHRAYELAPGAESLNAVAKRADLALRHFVLPHLLASAKSDSPDHVMLFAHGIFLSEMMFALKRAHGEQRYVKTSGYTNTGWSRVEIEVASRDDVQDLAPVEPPLNNSSNGDDDEEFDTPPSPSASRNAASEPVPVHLDLTGPRAVPPRHDALPPAYPSNASIPRIKFKVVAFNQTAHLDGLARQKGGIGSSAHDEKQRSMKEFFGGGAAASAD